MQLLTTISLLSALGLLAWVLLLRAKLARLEAEARTLAAAWGTQLPQSPPAPAGKPMLITIEILNLVELARKESWFAGAFGSLTPALLRRIVYAKTVPIIEQQMLQYDVKADVRVLGDG